MQIPADRLASLGQAIFKRGGADAGAAAQVAEKLVEANLFGHDSHGIGMVPAYIKGIEAGELRPGNGLSVEQDRGPFLLLDGNGGFGQVVAKAAMELAIARAQEMGVAVVGLKNSYHIGRVGAWAAPIRDFPPIPIAPLFPPARGATPSCWTWPRAASPWARCAWPLTRARR